MDGGRPGDAGGASGAGGATGAGGTTTTPPTMAGAGGTTAGAGGASASAGEGAGGGSASGGSCGDDSTGGGMPAVSCGELGGICGECIQEKCCELAELCTVDADCTCMATCIGTESLSGIQGCLGSCGLTGSPVGFADFANCAATTCPDGDECSAPSEFQPPADVMPPGPASNAGIGSGALADCSFGAADATGAVLQLQNSDGSVCVRIERRDDGPGSMANTSWTLLSMRVGPLGEVVLVDDPSDLCWYSSHHNFNDWAHAWRGSRHYDVKTSLADHGATPTYALHVFEAGPLAPDSCAPIAEGTCPIATIDLVPAP